jgi:small-conductance mechanosensitive channel
VFVLYKPILFLHIFFGFLYMLSHGASVTVAYRLRHESGLERVRALLDLSRSSFILMYVALLAMLLGGVALGFLGRFWSSGWIWASLGLLIGIIVAMSLIASRHFHRVRKAAGLPYLEGTKEHPPVDPASPEDLRRLLQSGSPHLMTLIGLGGWAVILWLMIFKPF